MHVACAHVEAVLWAAESYTRSTFMWCLLCVSVVLLLAKLGMIISWLVLCICGRLVAVVIVVTWCADLLGNLVALFEALLWPPVSYSSCARALEEPLALTQLQLLLPSTSRRLVLQDQSQHALGRIVCMAMTMSVMQCYCGKVWVYHRVREGEARMERHSVSFVSRVNPAASAGWGAAVLTKRRGDCACVQESMRAHTALEQAVAHNASNFGRVGVCQQQYRC